MIDSMIKIGGIISLLIATITLWDIYLKIKSADYKSEVRLTEHRNKIDSLDDDIKDLKNMMILQFTHVQDRVDKIFNWLGVEDRDNLK